MEGFLYCTDWQDSFLKEKIDLQQDMELFDRAMLIERLGDEEIMDEVLEVFLLDVPVQLEKLKVALEAEDYTVAGFLSHSLKGAAMNVNAGYFEHCARDLEVAARQKEGERATHLYGELDRTFEKLVGLMARS
jgi:HPt (histidine-containing phosphotransfer) domain-containing protein